MFFELLEYKLKENGGTLIKVAPEFTSQICNCCGHVSKENRQSQAKFVCTACGHSDNADTIPFIFQNMDNRKSPHLLAS
jgi:putative transposase